MNKTVFRAERGPESPGEGSVPITPSDSTDITGGTIYSLYVTVAGDVKFTGVDGTTDTWTVPANYLIPIAMDRVWSTGTTATGLHGVR